jgi:hypothetical protein
MLHILNADSFSVTVGSLLAALASKEGSPFRISIWQLVGCIFCIYQQVGKTMIFHDKSQ